MKIKILPGQENDQYIKDLIVQYSTDNSKIYIFDYKSGKTPSSSKYKNQLMLYAYLKGKERGWDYNEIAERVKLFLFFPLSEQTKPITDFDKMLASVKEIKYDADMLKECIDDYVKTIQQIQEMDWSSLDDLGVFNPFTCKWCEHMGGNKNNEGYQGCQASHTAGYYQERGVTYTQKKKLQEAQPAQNTQKIVQERKIQP